jgi:DNA-directed RNA polymerase subunit K/omega
MIEKPENKNAFELVVLAGARARQLLRGCTPRTQGPEKPARLAALEIKHGHVRKVPLDVQEP